MSEGGGFFRDGRHPPRRSDGIEGRIGPGLVGGTTVANGSNIVVATYDLRVRQANQLITNVAR